MRTWSLVLNTCTPSQVLIEVLLQLQFRIWSVIIMGKLLPVFTVLVVSIGVGWIWINFIGDAPVPDLPKNQYWGPAARKGQKEDTSVRPFKIAIPASIVTDLKTRLALETSANGSRLTPPLEGVGFEYGYNSNHLKAVTNYWLEKYDWKSREMALNKYPHFKTTIFGIEIHFQHVKSVNNAKYKVTRPLLLLHGWPGSFVEFQKIIPLLTDPAGSDVNFELIIPSLPGYGFSERAHKVGLGPNEMAQIFDQLMVRLGHQKYYVQGGDWGALIVTNMGALFPTRVKAVHLSMCMTFNPKSLLRFGLASIFPTLFMSQQEATVGYPLSELIPRALEETGYFHLQATKPDTVGVGLSNSPSGLAAYVLEKFSGWTNLAWKTRADGGLAHFKLDDLLDNVMVYWVTNSITSSVRLYSEAMSKRQMDSDMDRVPVTVPTACLQPPQEKVYALPKWAIEGKYPDLRRYNIAARGGHFLAFEEPELVAKDIIGFIQDMEKSKVF